MTVRLAINGFGRIGRLLFRSALEAKRDDIDIVAINDLSTPEANAHLLKYDSVHGSLPWPVTIKDSGQGYKMLAGDEEVQVFSERDPARLPWKDLAVDVVAECTGIFTSRDKASAHLKAGAKKVLISAPASGEDATIVFGVNHNQLTPSMEIVSNASCTTNCLAPVAWVLHQEFGIKEGYCTTIHAYTGDQRTVDTFHSDLHRARAAAVSMIPTSTGAAKAVGKVLPELNGKLDGSAIRVPTPNVSLVDLTFVSKNPLSVDAINAAMKSRADGPLKGILDFNTAPLVSADFNHTAASSTFDATQTQVLGEHFGRVLSWYDNEWGFSNRMLDTSVAMMKA